MNKKTFAEIISKLFDPPVLGIVILLVAIGKSKMSMELSIVWTLSVLFLNGFVPFLFYLYFTKKGMVFDDTLEDEKVHKQRIVIFLVFFSIVAIELLILVLTQIYQPLLAIFSGGLIALGLAIIITYWWKISLHSSLVTIFVAMLIFIYGLKVWPVILFIPLVFWSRLYMKRHTFAQLFGGFVVSLLIVGSVFYLYGIMRI